MNNTLLELKNISYKYKNNLILNKINLKINSGEKIALLGKSGSGKTTLISVLNGTTKPTLGEVKLFNKSFEELDRKQKSEITTCLLYTSPSPRDPNRSRMPSSA